MNDHHLSREQLYAYADGVVFGAEQRAVERHLAICNECRAQLARSSAIVHGLKQLLGSTSAPASLRMAIREQISERVPRRATPAWLPTRGLAFASLAVSGLLVAILITFVFRLDGGQSLVGQLVEKHRQLAREPQSIQTPGDAGLSTWMDAQVNERIDLPALEGFSLAGGRVDKVDGQLAAHVLYQQTSTTALSIFVWRGDFSTDNLAPRQVNGDPYYVGAQSGETVVLWRERDVNYACVGEVKPEAVLELAARVRGSDSN
jgi:anti-sigma factor RsiW